MTESERSELKGRDRSTVISLSPATQKESLVSRLRAAEKRSDAASMRSVSYDGGSSEGRPNAAVTLLRMRRTVTRWRGRHRQPAAPVALQNTYKMRPDDGTSLSVRDVTNVIKEVLHGALDKHREYDPQTAGELSRTLADEIKTRVKSSQSRRYKLVCQVVLGQSRGQGAELASRCVWDASTDTAISYVYNGHGGVYAVGLVFAVYFE